MVVGIILGVVVLVAAAGVGGALFLFSEDGPLGTATPEYPQSYDPAAEVFAGGSGFTYQEGFDACQAFSHDGLTAIMPKDDSESASAPGETAGTGAHDCNIWIKDDSDEYGDLYSSGKLYLLVGIYEDAATARSEFDWDLEIRAEDEQQAFDGLGVEAIKIAYDDSNGQTVYLSALADNMWVNSSLSVRRPTTWEPPPEIPTEVLVNVLTDVMNEAMTAVSQQ